MNKEEVQEFATKCYNFFNGWINPTVKSQELKFGLPKYNHNIEHVLATTMTSTIYLEPNRMVIEFDFRGYKKESEMKYLIAHIIAHELSHVGQKIDSLLIMADNGDKKFYGYRKFIENSNDYNTCKFMVNNWDMITEELGDLGGEDKLNTIKEKMHNIASIYSGNSDSAKDMSKLYEMEENEGEKVASSLAVWTRQNLWSIVFANGAKEGYVVIHGYDGTDYPKKFLEKCKIYNPEDMLLYIANVDQLVSPFSSCFSVDKNENDENILNIHIYPLRKESL